SAVCWRVRFFDAGPGGLHAYISKDGWERFGGPLSGDCPPSLVGGFCVRAGGEHEACNRHWKKFFYFYFSFLCQLRCFPLGGCGQSRAKRGINEGYKHQGDANGNDDKKESDRENISATFRAAARYNERIEQRHGEPTRWANKQDDTGGNWQIIPNLT